MVLAKSVILQCRFVNNYAKGSVSLSSSSTIYLSTIATIMCYLTMSLSTQRCKIFEGCEPIVFGKCLYSLRVPLSKQYAEVLRTMSLSVFTKHLTTIATMLVDVVSFKVPSWVSHDIA